VFLFLHGPGPIRCIFPKLLAVLKERRVRLGDFDKTGRFDDIVSVMVPFALTDSHTRIEMGFMLDYATGNSEEEGPVIQYERRHFTAKLVVTTAAWDDKQHKMKSANAAHGPDLDVLPISRSSLNRTFRGEQVSLSIRVSN